MPKIVEATALPREAAGIPEQDRETARRYIVAIVAHERPEPTSPTFVAWRTGLLWAQFVADYADITSGPFARHGSEALAAALRRL